MSNQACGLAVTGGPQAVLQDQPHLLWPPQPSIDEQYALGRQRAVDISIKGSSGPVKEFEQAFLAHLEYRVDHAVTFNSGTSALLAAYLAVGIKPGDEVLCPGLTYHAAVTPLQLLQALPVPVDLDPVSYNLDLNLLDEAITPHTKAVTVVHQWGHPVEMNRLVAFARAHQLDVIEDCSHAHWARWQNQPVGTFGDVAVFSLQANKLVFGGEGGVLVTNDQNIHDRAVLVGHYRDRARDEIIAPELQTFWQTGYGLKLRMSPYNAVTALYSLRSADQVWQQRDAALRYFHRGLQEIDWLEPPQLVEAPHRHGWYGFKTKLHLDVLPAPAEALLVALQAEGVEVNWISSTALSLLPLFQLEYDPLFVDRRRRPYARAGQLPVAEDLSRRLWSWPTFSNWPADKTIIDDYIEALRKVTDQAAQLTTYWEESNAN